MHLTLPFKRPLRVQFRPRWWSTLLVAAMIPAFVGLGNWQLGKARTKEAAQATLDGQRADAPVALAASLVDDPESLRLRPVVARGEYDASGQVLIDNRVLHERAGLHVLTPLRIAGSETRVLVNRGWIPAPADRRQAPTVAVPSGPVVVEGTAVVPSRRIFALAQDTALPGGNAIWQNLDLDRYRSAARHPVQPIVIQLDPNSPAGGFDRAWPRLDERHERHLSYAFQWYGFALASVGIWLYFAFRRAT
jgi:surfeit locus 1 family protein